LPIYLRRKSLSSSAVWTTDKDGLVPKVLAQRIIAELESKTEPTLKHDGSTNNLIHRYRKLKEKL